MLTTEQLRLLFFSSKRRAHDRLLFLYRLASVYRDQQLIGDALAKTQADAEQQPPEIEQRLASIGAEITRAEQALEGYYEAFEHGKLSPERCEQRLTRLQARLDDLHAQQAELSAATPYDAGQAVTPPTSPPSPTNSNASSPRPSRRRPRRCCGC